MSHPVSPHQGLPADRFTHRLLGVIRLAVRVLALLMAFVILMGVIDVVWVLYQRLVAPPFLLLEIRDILGTFGAFMAVLIAIEIFVNITIYLRDDVIHIKIVMATALMAIARKVIIMDMQESTPAEMYGLAAVTLAMSVGYWLVVGNPFGGRADQEASQPAPPLPSRDTGLPAED